ncbi:Bck2p KNAG_0G01840 [Huiozyma naganishii CBS 8797]|uniref:Uncharacterized protein n=1 Tax=Huiozyma naganishii (strain ATCC MYA-139 / BCRC 22969 / CBS 8797 / KCTC 17520 / NBRC 10181 / NCYC 3082 / Yp74L-3) TaxID=1071383 RepID=J7S103_HUIN7|nr:hypothetical protein KNAG_0G01840 [Kazachstania naganishii CBS 8797]CCK71242.1 hypothetical protein KNAG_0G01840 [Kazachstania naganishii CBS 8797]
MGRIGANFKPTESPRSMKGPSTDSVNKWKIPHYYKRTPSQNSPTTTTPIPGNTDVQNSPNINVMNSPKKVVLDDSKVGGSKPKKGKKKNGMVFVNYTVQDEEGNKKKTPTDHDNRENDPVDDTTTTMNTNPHSSRKRMLKIFRSSKSRDSTPNLVSQSPAGMAEIERSISSPSFNKTNSQKNAPKRSYNSFLKCRKSNHITPQTVYSDNLPDDSLGTEVSIVLDDEVVPISKEDPSLVKPSFNITPQIGILPNSDSGNFQFFNNERSSIGNTVNGQPHSGENVQGMNVLGSHSIDNSSHTEYPNVSNGRKMTTMGNVKSQVFSMQNTDDNDASVAFNKMFTRKRANTGGSTPSIASPVASMNAISRTIAQRTASSTSLSSVGSRYSPLRTQSPARARSSTRASSTQRLSRDVSSIYNINEVIASQANAQEHDTYLDSQFKKRTSVISSPSLGNVSKIGHRRKQESISDTHGINAYNSFNGQPGDIVATTPSASFVTTPYQPPFPNSTGNPISSASTPSLLDTYNINPYESVGSATRPAINNSENGTVHYVENEGLADALDYPINADTAPIITSVQRKTNETGRKNVKPVHDFHGHNHSSKSDTSGLAEADFNPTLMNDSSTSSSGLESLMTNSLSTTASSSTNNNAPHNLDFFVAANNGLFIGDNSPDHFGKPENVQSFHNNNSVTQDACIANKGHLQEDQLLQEMCMEFDFENPNSFFHEQSKSLASQITSNDDLSKYQKGSAVTSVGNLSSSPSTVVPSSVYGSVSNVSLETQDESQSHSFMSWDHPAMRSHNSNVTNTTIEDSNSKRINKDIGDLSHFGIHPYHHK